MAMIPAKLDLVITRGITFGPVTIICSDENNALVNLTGWLAYAEGRKKSATPAIVNFAPTVTNGTAGQVTIPAITDESTLLLPKGDFLWDFLLEKPTGERVGPFIAGKLSIQNKITQPT